jgi:PPOX class probable F420-dependent enzyme
MRQRVEAAPVARLGTISAAGRPHLVPCCFALIGDTVYTAVDAKPKSTTALRRLHNLATNPAACLLVDHYEDDWSRLWWVRIDGRGRVVTDQLEADRAQRALEAKYSQYRSVPILGPWIALDAQRWLAWP